MSNFADKMKSRYASLPLGKVEVPEWELVIHVRPATIGQSSRIMSESDNFKRACRMIQVRAKKEDGSPLFDEDDYSAMVTHGEVDVIERVASAIRDLDDEEVEEDAKKP